MDNITHEMRESQWAAIIEECLASGMKKTTWCRENNISDKQFFYWQRRLREKAYAEKKALLVSGDTLSTEIKPVFAEITADIQEKSPVIHTGFCPDIIIHSGSTVIEISNSASPSLLAALRGIFHAE